MADMEVKSKVEAVLASSPGLSHTRVGADVYDGRVILVGDVETRLQETEALQAAKSVPGVREVISALRVAELKPRQLEEIDDATLKDHIEAALADHGIVIRDGGVDVTGGEAYLRGRVDTPRQRIQARRLATTIRGVRLVHNELAVRAKGEKGKRGKG